MYVPFSTQPPGPLPTIGVADGLGVWVGEPAGVLLGEGVVALIGGVLVGDGVTSAAGVPVASPPPSVQARLSSITAANTSSAA
jgi:hypothetical protein